MLDNSGQFLPNLLVLDAYDGLLCAVHTLTINQRCITVNSKMTRRALFFLAAADADKPPPVSEAAWNDFAGRANYYAEQLKLGIIDLRAWKSVLRAWERLR